MFFRTVPKNTHGELMKDLGSILINCISEDAYSGGVDGFVMKPAAAVMSPEGVLKLAVRTDFVVSQGDEVRMRERITEVLPHVSGVNFRYIYDSDHMAQGEGEIVRLYAERCVAGLPPIIRNAVNTDSITVEERVCVIKVIGGASLDETNKTFAVRIKDKIREKFGLDYDVRFEHDHDARTEVKKHFELSNEELAKIALEDAAKAEAERADMPDPGYSGRGYGAGDAYDTEGGAGSSGFDSGAGSTGGGRSGNGSGYAGGSGFPGRRRASRNIFGGVIKGEHTAINDLRPDMGEVVIEGTIFHIEEKHIRDDRLLVMMHITDKTNSTCVKAFLTNKQWEKEGGSIKEGVYVICRGKTEFNVFDNEMDVLLSQMQVSSMPVREDTYDGPHRVELHCHTKMSAMDGLNEPDKIVETAARWGQPAVAITDHGVVQSFPDAANTAKKLAKGGTDIKVIYGMEGYLLPDEERVGPGGITEKSLINEDGTIDYKARPTNHIIILVATQEGMMNLYKLVSISHLDYFYKRPRIPRSVLQKYRKGLILGSACEAGELFRAVETNASDEELERIADFYDYLEIQPVVNNKFLIENGTVNSNEDLQNFNRRVVELADRIGKPIVATTDAHYDEPESAIYRNILLAGMGYKDAANGRGLYLRTTQEMLDEFSYLGEETAKRVVIDNTILIADMIDDGIKPVPDEKCPPKIKGAEETLRTTCMKRAHEIYGDPLPKEIDDRLETELNAIINNGYAVMYVSAQMLVQKSLSDGYLVGSRGSVGSSLAATMAGITEVNPLDPHYICPKCKHLEWGDMQKYDCGIDMPPKVCPECGTEMRRDGFTIPFATFLGFEGNKEPDIDLNFAGEYQPRAHRYVGEIFGEQNVYKAGTVGTIADKTAYGYVMKFFEETGRPLNKYEAGRLAIGCTGVKRTTGQHPGGIIIVPDDHEIYEFCPVQHPANDTTTDIVTTHFDYHKIDKNLLKLDILGHNVPSMIRQLQDMTGVDPLKVDLTDKKVLSIFNGIEALDIKMDDYKFTHGSYAIPEFGTSFVRQMLDDVKPSRFEDLIRMSGFSHGTDVWLNNAQDYIRQGVATMREVISTRDDIMNFCMLKGIENEKSFQIMEDVRKKNRVLTDDDIKVMKEHNIPDWYIDSCSKIKYMFPRAHAVAYVMMSFRLAWYKVYYPVEFYATYFTSVAADFNADVALRGPQACLDRMDQIKQKGTNATAKEKEEMLVLEVVYEMYARGFEFAPARIGESEATRFWEKGGKVLLPFSAYSGVGESCAKSIYDAYQEKPFDTIEDAVNRAGINKAAADTLREHGVFGDLPERDQLSWAF